MEEAIKRLNIAVKILVRRSRAMWDILLASDDTAKSLVGNIMTTKSVRLQTEYLGTRKTKVILHGVHLYILLDHLGFFFSKFGKVARDKAGIAAEDVEVMVSRKNFVAIPNVLMYEGRPIYVAVEGRRTLCWICGSAGYMSKMCPGKRPEPQPDNCQAKH